MSIHVLFNRFCFYNVFNVYQRAMQHIEEDPLRYHDTRSGRRAPVETHSQRAVKKTNSNVSALVCLLHKVNYEEDF